MRLYFKGREDDPLTNEDGKLKTTGQLKRILGKKRISDLGFDVPIGKIIAKQTAILKEARERENAFYV